MSELKKISQDIERLREQLHTLVLEKKGKFVDEEVTRLSQQLDKLIVAYEKMKLTK
ncbi:aspartyl-phosphate phosphatase Spo0E family protein [Anaerosinus massiliensis]|uniref:aspartyl-phosphate phosphatase Spo0E family protein n=1 Tax=Massilibacillus massiliensis TaxID=1806837 RepID=UPI000A8762BF|nr:aspartyl-phosphate phosphatase Spo0E family protein [Massilibacillus massiliensis]